MDKRTASGIHVVKPVQAVYGPEGQVLATNEDQDEKIPIEKQVPKNLPENDLPEKNTMYLIDDWVFKGHRLNIVGVYDNNGYLQGGLFIADHDGTPHSLVKPDEEKGVLFNRLCDLLGVVTELPKEETK